MQPLTFEDFSPHVNETYSVAIQGSQMDFTLVEARPLQARVQPGVTRAPFSLLFLNASTLLFPQQIYTMRHQSIGEAGIFLVPVARHRDGYLYQAIFN